MGLYRFVRSPNAVGRPNRPAPETPRLAHASDRVRDRKNGESISAAWAFSAGDLKSDFGNGAGSRNSFVRSIFGWRRSDSVRPHAGGSDTPDFRRSAPRRE